MIVCCQTDKDMDRHGWYTTASIDRTLSHGDILPHPIARKLVMKPYLQVNLFLPSGVTPLGI